MGNKTINDLTALTSVVASDYFPLWDASGAVTRKATLTNILAVLLGQINTFTDTQQIAPASTNARGLTINMPASTTVPAARIRYNGADSIIFYSMGHSTEKAGAISLAAYDSGANIMGPYIEVNRNSNTTQPGAGFIRLSRNTGTLSRIWVDSTGVARIGGSDPINANDVSGTVIGAQTSMAEAKVLLGDVGSPDEALRAIVDAARHGLRRFAYKEGTFGGQEFEGIVTDLAPRYGMDRDEKHPQGKSLNEIQLFGDLIRAVALLAEKVGLA